jgi:hypothetical protein
MSGDADEHYSLKAASTVMLLLSLLSLGLRFGLSRPFFSPEFEASLVYVPTVVLSAAWLRLRSKERQSTSN